MKFALKTISPVTLNWNKDGDVNWLYGPFHTYEPLLQLQAAAKAGQSTYPACGNADCAGNCSVCEASRNSSNHPPHPTHLKPALKNLAETTSAPRRLLATGPRATSDPDLFSQAAQQLQNQGQQTKDFVATVQSIKTSFQRQGAIPPLTGKKADFFLASAAERERQARLRAASSSAAEDTSSAASSLPISPAPIPRAIRFAAEPKEVIPVSEKKKLSFGFGAADNDSEDADSEAEIVIAGANNPAFAAALDDQEVDLLVSQVKRKVLFDDDEDDESSEDDGDFGFKIGSKKGLTSKGIQLTASTETYTHSTSIGLQRTPSAEKGLSKLSNLSSALSNHPSTTSGSSASGGLQRSSSVEKGLSGLSSLSKQ
ncbi:hypothetical protein HDU99_000283 [Rhizoclosmatium hyalinum]|nr:hypothetical protein HDU99_000283 [Rhizoclosmatium hyalinum]